MAVTNSVVRTPTYSPKIKTGPTDDTLNGALLVEMKKLAKAQNATNHVLLGVLATLDRMNNNNHSGPNEQQSSTKKRRRMESSDDDIVLVDVKKENDISKKDMD